MAPHVPRRRRVLNPLILGFGIVALVGLVAATSVMAQAWRGLGRVAGTVTEESGQPVRDVVVKAYLPSAGGGTEIRTNRRGEWAVAGIARGEWQLDFVKEGYITRQIAVSVSEVERIPPIRIVLEKPAPLADPNAEIREGLVRAAAMLEKKQFAEAREVYLALLAKYPDAHQLYPLIARTFYGERLLDKALEHLRLAARHDPDNPEVQLLLGNLLIESGRTDEGRRIFDGVDETRITDPATFVNVGIQLLNQNRAEDALTYFDRTIARFPGYPDAYYLRGVTHLRLGKQEAARADLSKFLAAAPDAPEAATARQILEQLPQP